MILGDGIRLRAIDRSDLPRFVEWLNDPEVIENLIINVPLSLDAETSWYEGVLQRPMAERPLVIEILEDGGWVMIGNVGLHNIDDVNRSAEFGIFIGEKCYWNRGWGRKAARLITRHGFENLNLNRISLVVYETNLRGIRAYEQAGFVHEGRLRQARYLKGRYVDEMVMSILKSEWQNQ